MEPPDKSQADRAAKAAAAAAQESSTGSSVDQASFSFDGARVQALQAQVLAQPEIRGPKVEQLRQTISRGEHQVSDSQIADSVMTDLRVQGKAS